jgi:3-oxoacyl-[acyl-carrier-protein] synthase I
MGTYIAGDNIITSLGFTTAANFDKISSGTTGVKIVHESNLYPEEFPASLVDKSLLNSEANEKGIDKAYTRFEQLIILSITDAVSNLNIDLTSPKTLLIISTTKGNIDLLKDNKGFPDDRVYLWKSAQEIGLYFHTAQTPVVISNACVSGVLALIFAYRMIGQGRYENVIVCAWFQNKEQIRSPRLLQGYVRYTPYNCLRAHGSGCTSKTQWIPCRHYRLWQFREQK